MVHSSLSPPCTCMVELKQEPGRGDDLIWILAQIGKDGREGKRVEYSSRDDERQKEVDLVGQTCESTRHVPIMVLMKGLESFPFPFYSYLQV